MAKFRIENVVASTSLGHELDLKAIALALGGSEYEPEQFPGLIYRIQERKTAIRLCRSGKVGGTGAKSLENVKTAIDLVSKQIQAAGIPIKKDPEIEVQNIVATSDLGAQIDLNAVAITLGLGSVEYEPEQFPGLDRSEEHTSELQSPDHLVCRLLLEKKKSLVHRGQRSGRRLHFRD